MALESVHPKYAEMKPEWDKMRDIYKGERHVKEQGEKYLPATKSMKLDGMGAGPDGKQKLGQEVYDAYRSRAVLPDYVQDAVEMFIGLLHSNPPTIELPDAMEPLRDKATMYGESIAQLLRRVNEEQLVTGRLGLLLDLPLVPDPTNPLPYIALYITEAARNWDDNAIGEGEPHLNLVVLDESGYKRDGFDWTHVSKFRVLQVLDAGETAGKYSVGVFEVEGAGWPSYVESDLTVPSLRGNELDKIPFVFVNTKDITPDPDKPPLLGLANAVLTILRSEADYRQNLFMQGQDTFVVTGDFKKNEADINETTSDAPVRTGAGSMVHLEQGATAEYVGVDSMGLSEQRTALENDRKRAETKAGQLTNSMQGDKESGVALQTRVGAATATLNQIALTGAAAVEWLLKVAAMWMGADPDKVKVTPNLEFADYLMTADELLAFTSAKKQGAPISWKSIHALAAAGNLTKLDYDTEREEIEAEPPEVPPEGTMAGGDPDIVPPAGTPPVAQ